MDLVLANIAIANVCLCCCHLPFRASSHRESKETEPVEVDAATPLISNEEPTTTKKVGLLSSFVSSAFDSIKAAVAPSTPPTLDDITDLTDQMLNLKGEKSVTATKKIYELCDVHHKENRVPMVCSGKYDVVSALSKCLTRKTGDGLHLACLALNNLSIPTENKRVMALGPSSKELIGGLCKVIAQDKQASYLCCICITNLSLLEASLTSILQFSPSDGTEIPLLDNRNSLLRVLEKLLTHAPAVPNPSPGERESVRWTCGLIKNLAKSEENAALIVKTDIPKCAVENIRSTAVPPSQWTSSSLEDASLFVILNLAQWPVSRESLINAGAIDVINPIMEDDGRQGLKTIMTGAFLGVNWTSFPEGGKPAAKSVSELMTNIVEKKGKDGQYAHGVFELHTATKAYRDLVRAAAEVDPDTNANVLAIPSAVALILKIISDVVISSMDNVDGDSKHTSDVISSEYAVGALEAMLPAILQPADPPRKSIQSERGSSEISQMLLLYASVPGTNAEAKRFAKYAAAKITESSSFSRPILETSYDFWTHYRRREGQPLDQFVHSDEVFGADLNADTRNSGHSNSNP